MADEPRVVIVEEPTTVTVTSPETVEVTTFEQIVSVIEVAVQGPAGAPGQQGTPGANGDGSFVYTHTQAMPSATWTIVHNLGGFPSVNVVDSAGTQVEGDVDYVDSNTVVVNFAAAFAGTAHLS